DEQAAGGIAPRIVSPLAGVTYYVQPDREAHRQIALQAVTDGDVDALYWFVDDRFVARADRDAPVLWTASAGRHSVVAVDDAGRSHSRMLEVGLAR
ncbi:MAG: penicillin-binding protein 1C, partial [Pseudomonadota bacterium]